MFGGVGFIVFGNMACGVLDDDLIVRVGVENSAQALRMPFARQFELVRQGDVRLGAGGSGRLRC